MTNSKAYYDELLSQNLDVPLFFKSFWLNSVCGENAWDIKIVEKNGKVSGIFPYYATSKYNIINGISTPPFTPYLGYKLFYPENLSKNKYFSFEKNTITELFKQLPNVHFVQVKLMPEIINWLPLYWLNFEQYTRYTYILNDLSNLTKIFNGFESTTKSAIKKSENKLRIECKFDADILNELHILTFMKHNLKSPYNIKEFQKLVLTCETNTCGYQLSVLNENENVIATSLFLIDKNCVYSILRAANPVYNSIGGMTFLIWEAIKYFALLGFTKMDFVGSMIKTIEAFIRSFGAVQTPYFNISKENTYWYYILKHSKEYFKSH